MIELAYPGALDDVAELSRRLSKTGLSRHACISRARLFAKANAALAVAGKPAAAQPAAAFFVPGRIEILGKHTDYAGGRTMVAAVEHGFCLAAAPRDDRQIVVIDAVSGETIVFAIDPDLQPQSGTWANYPMTVVRRLARNFPGALVGADVAFAADLPPAAGMSSSSALVSGVFLALAELANLSARDEYWHNIGKKTDLAGYLGAIENGASFGTLAGDRGVGTFGGSEDHVAMFCAEPGRISQYAYCPVEFEKTFAVPRGYTFAIGFSGVAVEKTGGAQENYNTTALRAAELAALWRKHTGRDEPHLAAALGSSPDAAARLKEIIAAHVAEPRAAALLGRLEHFMLESGELVPEAGDALEGEDLRTFGSLVDRSQQAAEELLGNQTPETSFLAASARRCGAAAASSFGAGFGGSVWALVAINQLDDFLAEWADGYHWEFPRHIQTARFFATAAGPAAFRVC
jgi:galactokinase